MVGKFAPKENGAACLKILVDISPMPQPLHFFCVHSRPFGVDLMNVVPLPPQYQSGVAVLVHCDFHPFFFLPLCFLTACSLSFSSSTLPSVFSACIEIIVIEYWERGQLGSFFYFFFSFFFVFSSTSFSHGHVSGPFFSLTNFLIIQLV